MSARRMTEEGLRAHVIALQAAWDDDRSQLVGHEGRSRTMSPDELHEHLGRRPTFASVNLATVAAERDDWEQGQRDARDRLGRSLGDVGTLCEAIADAPAADRALALAEMADQIAAAAEVIAQERREVLRGMLASGMTTRAVGQVLGMSHSRVAVLAKVAS